MADTTPATFSLLPATRDDIPHLAKIHVDACLPDNCFKLYFSSPTIFNSRVTAMLENQVSEPNWTHIKVIDHSTNTIAAWASWNTPTDTEIRERDLAAEKAAAMSKDNSLEKGSFEFPPGLPMFVQRDTDKWLHKWTKGMRYVRCMALFTLPEFEKRGMGSALVKYGNQLADEKGLPIFLQASPFGYPVYEKFGFEVVQVLDVDLREWVDGGKEDGDKGYGNYRFRYMVRLPRTLPKAA